MKEGETVAKDKKILLHHEPEYRKWAEIEITLRKKHDAPGPEDFDVIIDGKVVDRLTRDPRHRTHQVHNRIRYDNKPTTRFRAQKYGIFYQDTRNEAIGDILVGLKMTRERLSVHIPGRQVWWRSCDICDGSPSHGRG